MKTQPMIEYITCESGDWCVIKKFGNILYEGHSVPDHVWLGLINTLLDCFSLNGQSNLKITAVSDKDMEEGNY